MEVLHRLSGFKLCDHRGQVSYANSWWYARRTTEPLYPWSSNSQLVITRSGYTHQISTRRRFSLTTTTISTWLRLLACATRHQRFKAWWVRSYTVTSVSSYSYSSMILWSSVALWRNTLIMYMEFLRFWKHRKCSSNRKKCTFSQGEVDGCNDPSTVEEEDTLRKEEVIIEPNEYQTDAHRTGRGYQTASIWIIKLSELFFFLFLVYRW